MKPSNPIFNAHYNLQYRHLDVRPDLVHNIFGTVICVLLTFNMWGLQSLRYYAANRKVAILFPFGVMKFFIDVILPIALCPWGSLIL